MIGNMPIMDKFFRLRTGIIVATLALLSFPVFSQNALGTAPKEMFDNWQLDSSALVLASVQAHALGQSTEGFGLSIMHPNQMDAIKYDNQFNSIPIGNTDFVPYPSSIGFQGFLAKGLSEIGFSGLRILNYENAALFSIVFAIFIVLISILISKTFAAILGIIAISSPWIVTAAREPYWSLWTWYLPLVFLALYYLSRNKKTKWVYAILATAAFVLRFGSGYEFITSISLFGAALPLLAKCISTEWTRSWRQTWVASAIGFAIAISGFIITFLWHSAIRGSGNIFHGAVEIINNDVLRRTYGPSNAFGAEYADSLIASPIKAFNIYLFEWHTDFLTIGYSAPFNLVFGSTAPWALLTLSTLIILVLWATCNSLWRRFGIVLIAGFVVSMSWYLFGKAHSIVHSHINFILWYLLLAPSVFYVSILGTFEIFKKSAASIRMRFLSSET